MDGKKQGQIVHKTLTERQTVIKRKTFKQSHKYRHWDKKHTQTDIQATTQRARKHEKVHFR